MSSSFGGIYSTGTAFVNAGDTTVTILGALLTTQAIQGDLFVAGGVCSLVDSVTDDETLELATGWAGGTLSGADYQLAKISWSRYDPAITQQQVRALLAVLTQASIIYSVSGNAPDDGLGDDDQYALKTTGGAWTLWLKVGGAWVEQGSPVGVTPMGAWLESEYFLMGDVVSYAGRGWLARAPSLNVLPAEGDYWMAITGEPSRLEIRVSDIGKPGASEGFVRELCTSAVVFLAGLAGAYAKVTVAPTADAVFSLRYLTAAAADLAADGPAEIAAATEFATCTIAAGQKAGVFACPADANLAAGDLFIIVGPDPQDDTLSGLSMSVVAYGS
jgi:hypothetical protein